VLGELGIECQCGVLGVLCGVLGELCVVVVVVVVAAAAVVAPAVAPAVDPAVAGYASQIYDVRVASRGFLRVSSSIYAGYAFQGFGGVEVDGVGTIRLKREAKRHAS
jgi:hypothetical protein